MKEKPIIAGELWMKNYGGKMTASNDNWLVGNRGWELKK